VLGLDVLALGFQFGDRDGLHQFDHIAQPLAEGQGRRSAVVEDVAVTAGVGVRLVPGRSVEALRLQHFQGVFQPRAPCGWQLIARRALAHHA